MSNADLFNTPQTLTQTFLNLPAGPDGWARLPNTTL
jgi:hypothetical protein